MSQSSDYEQYTRLKKLRVLNKTLISLDVTTFTTANSNGNFDSQRTYNDPVNVHVDTDMPIKVHARDDGIHISDDRDAMEEFEQPIVVPNYLSKRTSKTVSDTKIGKPSFYKQKNVTFSSESQGYEEPLPDYKRIVESKNDSIRKSDSTDKFMPRRPRTPYPYESNQTKRMKLSTASLNSSGDDSHSKEDRLERHWH